jgi:deoxyadenosine/deoxycytidine kinase
MNLNKVVLGVVGPCASGKSTLVAALRSLNYQVRHIAQEHSYVSDMWRQIGKPDFLIYLDVSYQVSTSRTGTDWSESIYNKQIDRLKHARNHADLYIHTDELTPQHVLEKVLEHI